MKRTYALFISLLCIVNILFSQSFTQHQKVVPSDGSAGDTFGRFLDIRGDYAVISSFRETSGTGAVYVFKRNASTGMWTEVKKVVAPDGSRDDLFGYSAKIYGNMLAVSSPFDDDKGSGSGAVYLFQKDEGGTDNWGFLKKLTASNGSRDDQFGFDLDLSGNFLLVGARFAGPTSGQAYIYERNKGGFNQWEERAILTMPSPVVNDLFGFSVAISKETAVISAIWKDARATNSGAAFIYSKDHGGTNNWGYITSISPSDGAHGDEVGRDVDIQNDLIVISATHKDAQGGNSGAAYLFQKDEGGTNNWGQFKRLLPSDGATNDFFSYGVSLSGDYLLIGAHQNDIGASNSGSAYVFHKDSGGTDNWGEINILTASDAAQDDAFGVVTSLSGKTGLIGASGNDDQGTNSGSAYFFTTTSFRNQHPTEIVLHQETLNTPLAHSSNVAQLLCIDDDQNETFTYQLVSGVGDEWNHAFTLSGNSVLTATDTLGSGLKAIRVRVTDGAGNVFDEQLTIKINSAPTDILFTQPKLHNPLHQNDVLGQFSTVDSDQSTGFSYQLVSGAGDTHNHLFSVVGSELRLAQDYMTPATLLFRVEVNDGNGATFSKSYSVRIDQTPYVEKQKLLASDGESGDVFGRFVDVLGDYAVVSSFKEDGERGAVYVYKRQTNGVWSELKKLTAPDKSGGDRFGYSVKLSGALLAVSSPYDDDNGSNSGSVYVFHRDKGGTDQFGFIKKVVAPDGSASDEFGFDVSISGGRLLVGSRYQGTANQGAAYVFSQNASGLNQWGLVKKLVLPSPVANDMFGFSVDIEQETAVVSAIWRDARGNNSGAAYVYEGSHGGENNWGLIKTLYPTDGSSGDETGREVDIEGDMIALSVSHKDIGGANAGAVYLFKRNEGGTNFWGQFKRILASDAGANDLFGFGLSMSGNYLAVGAYQEDHRATDGGSVYIFHKDSGGVDNWGEIAKVTPFDNQGSDLFGVSVAISGSTAVMGASYNDEKGSNAGAAYIYSSHYSVPNQKPKSLTVSQDVKRLPLSSGTPVSSVYAHDHDQNDVFTYALVSGSGDAHNQMFRINDNRVALNTDTLSPGTKSVRIRVTDSDNNTYEQSVSLYFNQAPTDISFTQTELWNPVQGNAYVGAFSTSDQDEAESFTYSLVSGSGDDNNGLFQVQGDSLYTLSSISDHGFYLIRVSVTDISGNSFTKSLLIEIKQDPFTEQQKLVDNNGASGDRYGRFLDVQGNRAVISSIQDNSGRGSVFLYEKNVNTKQWSLVKKVSASDPANEDNFGYSVRLSGDYLAVGAIRDDEGGSNSGSVYLFNKDEGGTNQWGQIKKLNASNPGSERFFGFDVDMSGDLLLVGARGNGSNNFAGGAYIFHKDSGGTNEWGQIKHIGGAVGNDLFGASVIIEDTTVVVSAPWNDGGVHNSGAVYIYTQNNGGVNNWGLSKLIRASGRAAGDEFGRSVSLKGNVLAVSNSHDDDYGSNSGSVLLYGRNTGGTNAWGQIRKIHAPTPSAGDLFGFDLQLSGDLLVVGAYLDDDKGANSGSAFVFKKDEGGADAWGFIRQLNSSDGRAGDLFGISVAISGSTIFAGASEDDDSGSSSGSVYSFEGVEQTPLPPVNISLTPDEMNYPVSQNTFVGRLSTVDPDQSSGFSYSFVNGAGDIWNGSFRIASDSLYTATDTLEVGLKTVRIQVNDGAGGLFSRSLDIRINGNPKPKHITLSQLPYIFPVETGTAIGTLTASDPNQVSGLQYTLVSGNGTNDRWNTVFRVSNDSLITLTDTLDAGYKHIYVRVTDSYGAFSEEAVSFYMSKENQAPIIVSPIQDYSLNEDFASFQIDLQTVFRDDSTAQPVFTVSGAVHLNASIQSSQALIRSLPNQYGTDTLVFTATDERGLFTRDTAIFTILSTEDAPEVANPIADLSLQEDGFTSQLFQLNHVFEDVETADEDLVMSFQLKQNLVSVALNQTSHQLTLTPVLNAFGEDTLYVSARDEAGVFGHDTVFISIAPVDDPPVVRHAIADISVNDTSSTKEISLSSTFYDVDNDIILKSVEHNSNTALVHSSITGDKLALSFPSGGHGSADIVVKGVANNVAVTDTFSVTVLDITPPEIASDILYSSVKGLGKLLNVHLFASEGLGKHPSVSIHNSTHEMALFDAEEFGYKFKYTVNTFGKQTFTFSVEDSAGNHSEDSVSINVQQIVQGSINEIVLDDITIRTKQHSFFAPTLMYIKEALKTETEETANGDKLNAVSRMYVIDANADLQGGLELFCDFSEEALSYREQKKVGLYKRNKDTHKWSYVSGQGRKHQLNARVESLGTYAVFYNENHVAIPEEYMLHQNYPNPFNPSTTILYDLPEKQQVQLTIFNVLGQKVNELVNSIQHAGYHEVKWDGKNQLGQRVGSGIYFYQIRTASFRQSKKMVLIK